MKKDDFQRRLEIEEEFHEGFRKESRQERKRKKAKDQSKYKKTDIEKTRPAPSIKGEEDLQRGLVLSIHSQGMKVAYEKGEIFCYLRGGLKKEKSEYKNIVAVGDHVLFRKESEDEGLIMHVELRKSILCRKEAFSQKKMHVLAANVDQILITVSLVDPPLRVNIIDRYIIASKKGRMTPIVVFNKMDLLEDEKIDLHIRKKEKELLKECKKAYAQAKIPFITLSAEKEEGIEEIKKVMKNKISAFAGPSGMGKTSWINLITGKNFATKETVKKTKKGSHTTTKARLIPLPFGGWCVDTPGIKSFGIWDLAESEIKTYFSEIDEIGKKCSFPNCSHTHEPDCKVKEAVDKEKISFLRYDSYLALMEDAKQVHKRR